MGRKKGYDQRKIAAIISVLLKNPEGIWLRRIAKDTGMHPSTVTKYIDTLLKALIEDTSLGNKDSRPFLRVIRLKPIVIERLQEGQDINQIMRMLKLMENLR